VNHFYVDIGEDWFSYPNLYSEMVSRVDSGVFVEVGSWKGRSASFMGVEIINSKKAISLFCVDTWLGSSEHQNMDCVRNNTLYEEFLSNISPINDVITPLRMPSLEASRLFDDESIEFIFLDASHDYDDVLADIKAWYPKVKSGGVIAGHDYYPNGEHWQGVMKAVKEWSEADHHLVTVQECCWIVNKPLSKT
jgi:cephalosporin hydroxylase